MRRLDLTVAYPGGTSSAAFAYDIATRKAVDAVIIAAHFRDRGALHVFLRSCVRPPLALRSTPPFHDGLLWELPAGLIEPEEDPVDAAVRELGEELGFHADRSAMRPLGEWTLPVPAMIAERHVYFSLEVDPATRSKPTEDGSALEREAAILALPVSDALEHCRRGAIRDAKTELGLRRLAEAFA